MIEQVESGTGALYVPTIVLVEISEAAHAGQIQFGGGFRSWMKDLLSSGRYLAAELGVDVVEAAEALHGIPERGDRLIAATSLVRGCPLLTRDPDIAAAAGVEYIWD
jgi:PIN domain nuclease of toxin-antitoxin system